MRANHTEIILSPNLFSFFPKHRSFLKKATHHVVAIDFDGCTDTTYARAQLSDAIANDVLDHSEIEVIDVIIASLRQSFLLDYYNARHNSEAHGIQSCTSLLDDFFHDLHWKIALLFEKNNIQRPVPRIAFNGLLLSDILNHLENGTTFAQMKKYQHYTLSPEKLVAVKNKYDKYVSLARFNQRENRFEETSRTGFEFTDSSKILLLWVQMHYFSEKYGSNIPFIYRFVDDVPDIIKGVTDFFRKHPDLMPQNCALTCVPQSTNYDIYPSKFPTEYIQGTGCLNSNYRRDYWDMACKAMEKGFTEKNKQTQTNLIKNLLLNCMNAYKPSLISELYEIEEELELILDETPSLWDVRERPSTSKYSGFISLATSEALHDSVVDDTSDIELSEVARNDDHADEEACLSLEALKMKDSPVSIASLSF